MTPILILAGGASSRMGARDKLTEDVFGIPLLRHQALTALEVSHDVTILLRPGNDPARATVADLPVTLLQPEDALEGMGGSLRAGTRALRHHAGFLLLLADLIELTADDMRRVIAARDIAPQAHIWRGTTEIGAPGHPILFSAPTYPDLMALQGDTGGRHVIAAHPVHPVPLPGSRARRDLDTPEAWASWRARTDQK